MMMLCMVILAALAVAIVSGFSGIGRDPFWGMLSRVRDNTKH
jgi:hypothetical protein